MNYFESDKYYIFGAGNTAKFFKSFLDKQNKQVVAFLTSNGGGQLTDIDKVKIVNLSQGQDKIDTSIPVIIAVFNREKNSNINFITGFLKKFNFDKIISPYEFHNTYSDQLENWYWLTDKKFYKEHAQKYSDVKNLFDEPKSLDIFVRITDFLTSFDCNILPIAEIENQYFPEDINIWNNKGAFLDIGSFDGQTLIDAYRKYGKMQLTIAYEPDPKNIKLIKDKIENLNIADQIFFIPCGVWSKTETLKFSSGAGESSSIQVNGDITIQCLSLDETLLDVKIGYIKMDIEGAEIDALLGAQNTIKKYKPTLAISLYHKPEHLFTIPLLIKSWNLGYKFYIRSHGNNLLETVLYCVYKR
ncbi:MAG: FkbM family methyltransferase [Mariniphaga sp.]